MKVKVLRDATLTVKAGQLVEVDAAQAAIAERLGLVEPAKEEKQQQTKKKAK